MPQPIPAPVKPTVNAKFSADLYGFVEFDSILDSTQSFTESAGNGVIAKRGTFAGNHRRLTYTARNSRIGLKLKGPESEDVRSSAILEMDFLGNQPPGVSEASTFGNATFRFRHMALKLETPIVDLLAGQYWQLFGWQSYFHPNTVEIQGVPGQVYSRGTQVRLSHAFKSEPVTVELAIAAARPPQRDSAQPDMQGGIRLLINNWKGWHTAGSTGTALDAAGIGVSCVYRRFRVNDFSGAPVSSNAKNAGGISIDALIPIIPGTADHRDNALTLNGSFIVGTGIADLFTGLSGGIQFPALPNPSMATPVLTYTPNIDGGLVTYLVDATTGKGVLHSLDWEGFLLGLQYYLPGNVWVSANYSHMHSRNISLYAIGGMAGKVIKTSDWTDGNLFWDATKAIRFGAECAWFRQRFIDDTTATDYREQLSAFYIF